MNQAPWTADQAHSLAAMQLSQQLAQFDSLQGFGGAWPPASVSPAALAGPMYHGGPGARMSAADGVGGGARAGGSPTKIAKKARLEQVKSRIVRMFGFSASQVKEVMTKLKNENSPMLAAPIDDDQAIEELFASAVLIASALEAQPEAQAEDEDSGSEREMINQIDQARAISEQTAAEDKERAKRDRRCELMKGNLFEDQQFKSSCFLKALKNCRFLATTCNYSIEFSSNLQKQGDEPNKSSPHQPPAASHSGVSVVRSPGLSSDSSSPAGRSLDGSLSGHDQGNPSNSSSSASKQHPLHDAIKDFKEQFIDLLELEESCKGWYKDDALPYLEEKAQETVAKLGSFQDLPAPANCSDAATLDSAKKTLGSAKERTNEILENMRMGLYAFTDADYLGFPKVVKDALLRRFPERALVAPPDSSAPIVID